MATSSKDITEKLQPSSETDELNQYLGDIYKMCAIKLMMLCTEVSNHTVLQVLKKYTPQIKDT